MKNSATSRDRLLRHKTDYCPNLNVAVNPQIFQTDGPLGVRRSQPSVRFRRSSIGCYLEIETWPVSGNSMGRDARARGFFSILGPGMDFYRVPMVGEFRVHDRRRSYLGAQLVPPLIMGIQAQGVWSCANIMPVMTRKKIARMCRSSLVNELFANLSAPFEAAVKDGHVTTIIQRLIYSCSCHTVTVNAGSWQP